MEDFEEKDEPQRLFVSEIIDWKKTGLLKCPKSLMSEHICTVNMLKVPKHCINVHGSIFVIFFEDLEGKTARKTLF